VGACYLHFNPIRRARAAFLTRNSLSQARLAPVGMVALRAERRAEGGRGGLGSRDAGRLLIFLRRCRKDEANATRANGGAIIEAQLAEDEDQ
jgi:hypothetical protein